MDNNSVMVSICCLTYNHAPYVRECLDGFLMQQVNFPIEIIVHDDASTDGTQDVLREYKEKYPDLFHLILQTENQYSKGKHVTTEFLFPKARGKYIAFCEGDDYWTDSHKLQKQVDFLESHPDHSLCCHRTDRYIQDEKKFWPRMPPVQIKGEGISFKLQDWIRWGYVFQTSSVIIRRHSLDIAFLQSFKNNLDIHLFYSSLENGMGYFMKDLMSIYRIHHQGIWSGLCIENQKMNSFFDAYEIYQRRKNKYTREWIIRILGELVLFYIRKKHSFSQAVKIIPIAIRYCGWSSILEINKYIMKKIVDRYFK